ncbi:MAG: hypothetical protein JW822_03955 [Spirochaetales bacterium]|nr:hypothetical protein [Spirochaetales bacterium]
MKTKIFICIILFHMLASATWSFEFEITATSALQPSAKNSYEAALLVDNTWESWSEGVAGDGVGQKIFIKLKNHTITLNHFYIRNGYGNLKYYLMNNRVKKMKVSDSHGGTKIVELADTPFYQIVKLGAGLKGSEFTFEILAVYKGDKWSDTCISEINLDGKLEGFTECNAAVESENGSSPVYSGDIDRLFKTFLQDTLKYDVKLQDGTLYKLMPNDCHSDNPDGSEYRILGFYGNTIESDWSTCNTGGGTFAEYCSRFPGKNQQVIIVLNVEEPDYGGNRVNYYLQQGSNWQKQQKQAFPILKIEYFLDLTQISYEEMKTKIVEFRKDFESFENDQSFSFHFVNVQTHASEKVDTISVSLPEFMRYQMESEYNITLDVKRLYLAWNSEALEFMLQEDIKK